MKPFGILNNVSLGSLGRLSSHSLSGREGQAKVGHFQANFLQPVFSFLCGKEHLVIIAVVFLHIILAEFLFHDHGTPKYKVDYRAVAA